MSFANAIEAGRAFVAFGVDTRKFDAGLKRIQGRMRSFGAAMQTQGAAIGASLAFSTLPLVGAIKVFADLEEEMTFVAAAAGKTLSEIQPVVDAVRELGRTTSFTAKEVAAGALALARAGVAATSIPVALKSVVAFSKATRLEMGRAAEVVVDTLNAFGKPFSEAAKVVDFLTKASNSSSQTMEQLAEALSYAAPQAYGLGLSLENTVTQLALLANSGIKASIAGTGLQRILINMGKAAQQAKFDDMGISTVEEATGKTRDLSAILIDLNNQFALENLNKTERLAVLNDLFGRGSKAALVLSRSLGTSQDAYDAYLAKINSAKSAQEIQNALMNTTAGRLQIMRSAILETAEAIGSSFKDALASAVVPLNKLTEDISALFRNNTALGGIILKTMGAVLGLATAMFTLGTVTRLLAYVLMPALRAAVLANHLAFVLIKGTVVALGNAFSALRVVTTTTTAAMASMRALVAIIRVEVLLFKVALRGLTAAKVAARLATVAEAASNVAAAVANRLVTAAVYAGAAARAVASAAVVVYTTTLGILTGAITLATAGQWLLTAATTAFYAVISGPILAAAIVGFGVLVAAWYGAKTILKSLGDWFSATFDSIKESLGEVAELWKEFFGDVLGSGSNIAVAFQTGDIKLIFQTIWNELKFILKGFVVSFAGSLPKILGGADAGTVEANRKLIRSQRDSANAEAKLAAALRDYAKAADKEKAGARSDVSTSRGRANAEQFENDTLPAERALLLAQSNRVAKAEANLVSQGNKFVDRDTRLLEEERKKLKEINDLIDERIAKEAADISAQSGTGRADDPAVKQGLLDDKSQAKLDLKGLELDRKKNQLAIDKRASGNVESFQRNLTAPSSADVQGAAGFNSLLTSQNNPMVSSIQSLEFTLREEALKTQTLLQEQREIARKIKDQGDEITDLDDQLSAI